jgi:hypothetical protein
MHRRISLLDERR